MQEKSDVNKIFIFNTRFHFPILIFQDKKSEQKVNIPNKTNKDPNFILLLLLLLLMMCKCKIPCLLTLQRSLYGACDRSPGNWKLDEIGNNFIFHLINIK